jgi:hypothetical protein
MLERCPYVLSHGAVSAPSLRSTGDTLDLTRRETEGLAEVPDRCTRAVGRERGNERRAVCTEVLRDASDQLRADVAGEVDVDVGQPDHVFV